MRHRLWRRCQIIPWDDLWLGLGPRIWCCKPSHETISNHPWRWFPIISWDDVPNHLQRWLLIISGDECKSSREMIFQIISGDKDQSSPETRSNHPRGWYNSLKPCYFLSSLETITHRLWRRSLIISWDDLPIRLQRRLVIISGDDHLSSPETIFFNHLQGRLRIVPGDDCSSSPSFFKITPLWWCMTVCMHVRICACV